MTQPECGAISLNLLTGRSRRHPSEEQKQNGAAFLFLLTSIVRSISAYFERMNGLCSQQAVGTQIRLQRSA
jgi:hypothetical protein